MRSFVFALLVLVPFAAGAGCQRTASAHCEARQAFWEHAFADEDPAWARGTREHFVPSCTKLLSEAPQELRCRDRCLDEAEQGTVRGSEAAGAAYTVFTRCEANCLGAEPGPQPVEPPVVPAGVEGGD
jgi:hypothetical protein